MKYPEHDLEFTDTTIKSVEDHAVTFEDGWSIGIPDDCKMKIEPGMSARQYGQGIGRPVRGLFINGEEVWYRTTEEQKKHEHDELYGTSAQDILNRWDEGRSVFSCEMGGFGPGYEQVIQVIAFEVLRYCLEVQFHETAFIEDNWKKTRKDIEESVMERMKGSGYTGAQWGAALSLGVRFYRWGPEVYDSIPDGRSIQVQKNFPSYSELVS